MRRIDTLITVIIPFHFYYYSRTNETEREGGGREREEEEEERERVKKIIYNTTLSSPRENPFSSNMNTAKHPTSQIYKCGILEI